MAVSTVRLPRALFRTPSHLSSPQHKLPQLSFLASTISGGRPRFNALQTREILIPSSAVAADTINVPGIGADVSEEKENLEFVWNKCWYPIGVYDLSGSALLSHPKSNGVFYSADVCALSHGVDTYASVGSNIDPTNACV